MLSNVSTNDQSSRLHALARFQYHLISFHDDNMSSLHRTCYM